MEQLERKLGLVASLSVVVASMIGTGIFSTLGPIQSMAGNTLYAVFMWLAGGLVAIFGALTYAELATRIPKAGGEYVYLQKEYGEWASYLSGWVSVFVAFPTPVALAAVLSSRYLFQSLLLSGIMDSGSESTFLFFSPLALVWIFFFVHSIGTRASGRWQILITSAKVLVVGGLAFLGLLSGATVDPGSFSLAGSIPDISELSVGLLWISFAYNGWNATAYLAEEVENPKRILPKALAGGTAFVMVLYLCLALQTNTDSGDEMTVFSDMAEIAFGFVSPELWNLIFFAILLSSLSVNMFLAPRVSYALARDGLAPKFLSKLGKRSGVPERALFLQSLVTTVYLLTSSFSFILTYAGFTLLIFPILAVFGLYKIRRQKITEQADFYSLFGYPITPLLYVLPSVLLLVVSAKSRPLESACALLLLGVGYLVYRWQKNKSNP